MSTPAAFYKLMLVTNMQNKPMCDYLKFIATCVQAGVTSVQLREKQLTPEALFSFGLKLKEILDPLNIPLIINDHVDLALKLNASGVHLGQTDDDPLLARALLGPDKIIGVSTDTEEDLLKANTLPLDYVGVGAIFNTQNKKNVRTIWGTQRLQQAAPLCQHPIIAIGGINLTNLPAVLNSGASGIAVIGALHDVDNPAAMTQNLRDIIEKKGEPHVE